MEKENIIEKENLQQNVKQSLSKKLSTYLKLVYADYKEVFLDLYKGSKKHPIRSSLYFLTAGGLFYLTKHNPDQTTYRNQLIESSEKLILVSKTIQNPKSLNYLQEIEKYYNEGVIRRLNLILFSIIWIDNNDNNCVIYKSVCPYLRPRYSDYFQRIIDVGVLDKYWLLDKFMTDYDVNESEFIN